MQQRHPAIDLPPEVRQYRQALFDMLQPVALEQLRAASDSARRNDGGYLMCGNLLGGVQSGYSYGINGYDKWGCDISKAARRAGPPIRLLQYRPSPRAGGGKDRLSCRMRGRLDRDDRRAHPSTRSKNQLAKNGDRGKRIVLKIDVEGAEWDTFLAVPDEIAPARSIRWPWSFTG